MELFELDIKKSYQGLKKKEFSAVELAKAYLNRIKSEDKKISAFLDVTEKLALSQAKEADDLISKKKDIPVLTGIPLAVKDVIMVKGVKTTCASKILESYISPYDATCIKKLKEQGAVILGKTNLDEFAMGASTENSAFFPTKNPHDLERVPGGSSGGSAAAVASDMCCYALGSDTGGSIRQPASFCGVTGLKPTYGAVSRYGLVAFASSFDQIGPIAKTAEDAEIIFNAIKGKDVLDSTSIDSDAKSFKKMKDLKVGVPKEYFTEGIDSGVQDVVKNAIKKLEGLGAEIIEISLPHTKYVIPAYYLIVTSEASTNLAKFDGIKYGLSKNKGKSLLDVYLETRGEGFGDEVRRRIMLGTFALSSGYYDAYYLKAQKIRTLIKKDFEDAFKKVDIVLTPTAPTPAFKIGEKIDDLLSMYLSDIFTASANLVGLPAISLPAGFTYNLPVGFQLIGRYFGENQILETAKAFQSAEIS